MRKYIDKFIDVLKMYYDLNWSVFAINGSYMCLYTSNVCTRAFTK